MSPAPGRAQAARTNFAILGPLPQQNIDTGLGVERLAFLLQGVDNVYETDLLRPIIGVMEELSGVRYGADHRSDVRFRIIADHARSGMLLIGDGVTPGNEGRGYVLRRLLRRTIRSARLLGVTDPVMPTIMAVVRDLMSPSYPELATDFDRIEKVAATEEKAFLRTIASGSKLFEVAAAELAGQQATVLPGSTAFTLHDTQGFPIDLTLEMAAEAGLKVDVAEFERLMKEQKERARADAKARKGGSPTSPSTGGCSTRAPPNSPATPSCRARPGSAGCSARVARSRPRWRARRWSWCSTAPRSTPSPAARTPTPAPSSGPTEGRGARRPEGRPQAVRASHPHHRRRIHHRQRGAGLGRQGVADRRPAGALGHPCAARRAAPGARAGRAAVRVLQQARVPAPRLRLGPGPVRGHPQRAGRGQQPGRPGRPAGQVVYGSMQEARRWVPSPCSARPTTTPSGSWRSAGPGRWSCAAGRTSSIPRRSGRWRSPPNPRWAPACAGSRRRSASRRSTGWPPSAPWSASWRAP